jgi:hypothetical protein
MCCHFVFCCCCLPFVVIGDCRLPFWFCSCHCLSLLGVIRCSLFVFVHCLSFILRRLLFGRLGNDGRRRWPRVTMAEVKLTNAMVAMEVAAVEITTEMEVVATGVLKKVSI